MMLKHKHLTRSILLHYELICVAINMNWGGCQLTCVARANQLHFAAKNEPWNTVLVYPNAPQSNQALHQSLPYDMIRFYPHSLRLSAVEKQTVLYTCSYRTAPDRQPTLQGDDTIPPQNCSSTLLIDCVDKLCIAVYSCVDEMRYTHLCCAEGWLESSSAWLQVPTGKHAAL